MAKGVEDEGKKVEPSHHGAIDARQNPAAIINNGWGMGGEGSVSDDQKKKKKKKKKKKNPPAQTIAAPLSFQITMDWREGVHVSRSPKTRRTRGRPQTGVRHRCRKASPFPRKKKKKKKKKKNYAHGTAWLNVQTQFSPLSSTLSSHVMQSVKSSHRCAAASEP